MCPVTGITILYDAGCGICTHTRDWIAQQDAMVRIRFLAADSTEAKNEFSELPGGELAVVGNTGEVWLGNHAWIVCLWALRGYRDLAFRLTSPLLLMMAREAFALVSKNRAALSAMLRLRSERELENQLREVIVPRCQTSERWLE